MNPTPVAPISNGVQLIPDQQQAVLPEEFEAQLAGYLDKEKPSTIHKEISDSKKTNEQESNQEIDEEPADEMIILDSPLLYTGSFNFRQEQPTKSTLNVNEQPQVNADQLLNSSEIVFAAQVAVETEKIDAFAVVQKEESVPDTQNTQLLESSMEPLVIEVNEPTSRIQGEPIAKDGANLLVEEMNLIEMDQTQSTTKENEMVESILPTGRFLTSEWKNGLMAANQVVAKSVELTVNSLDEVSGETAQASGTSAATTDSGQPYQPNLDTVDSKLKALTEPVLNGALLKKTVTRMNDSENAEVVTQVAEVDRKGQPIQQPTIFEATAVKQSSVIEPVRQAGVQMISEVVLEQAETVLSGKQSVAHVTLTPEKMGEVKITVELTDNVLLTKIVVENLETRELLTTGMHHLTDKLDRQNIRLGELTIQLNENATAGFSSQERQGEEKRNTFRQHQTNFSDNEIEMLRTEEKTETNTGRLSILV